MLDLTSQRHSVWKPIWKSENMLTVQKPLYKIEKICGSLDNNLDIAVTGNIRELHNDIAWVESVIEAEVGKFHTLDI